MHALNNDLSIQLDDVKVGHVVRIPAIDRPSEARWFMVWDEMTGEVAPTALLRDLGFTDDFIGIVKEVYELGASRMFVVRYGDRKYPTYTWCDAAFVVKSDTPVALH